MPPWAAIECARLGLSWKTKRLTLYPSSASAAAAEAPARPARAAATSYLRLLAGLTRRMDALWLRHLSPSGPGGILESSCAMAGRLLQRADQDRSRDREVAEEIRRAAE